MAITASAKAIPEGLSTRALVGSALRTDRDGTRGPAGNPRVPLQRLTLNQRLRDSTPYPLHWEQEVETPRAIGVGHATGVPKSLPLQSCGPELADLSSHREAAPLPGLLGLEGRGALTNRAMTVTRTRLLEAA